MKSRLILIALMLGSCASKQAPTGPLYTKLPVVQPTPPPVKTIAAAKTVTVEKRCVPKDQIPPEPPPIGDKLTGIVNYDIGLLEKSARELREALRKARELLLKCAGDGK